MSYFQKAVLVMAAILWWQVAVEIANYNTANDNDNVEECYPTSAFIMNDSGDIIHLTTCDIDKSDDENDGDDPIRAALIEATKHHHDG